MVENMGKKRDRRMTRKVYWGNIKKKDLTLSALSFFTAMMILDVALG
jgi:hypothetical protein